MHQLDDMDLLRRYADTGSHSAFEELVSRHIDWVYAMSLRQVRDRHLAEDVTQAVFIILARKAASLSDETLLRGWLFKTARFAASDALKKRSRFRRHQERFAEMHQLELTEEQEEAWEKLSPVLDDAIASLNESDRHAVQLRFYEGKSLAQVGEILGISEEAAKKRVARAVDKLRTFFSREGVKVSAGMILTALAVPAAQAAPPMLMKATVTASTTGGSALAGTVAQGALRAMFQADARLVYAMMGATGLTIVVVAVIAAQFMSLAPPSLVAGSKGEKPQVKVIEPRVEAVEEPPVLNVKPFEQLAVRKEEKALYLSAGGEHGGAAEALERFTPHVEPDDTYAIALDSTGGLWYRKVTKDVLAMSAPDMRTAHWFPVQAGRGFDPLTLVPALVPAGPGPAGWDLPVTGDFSFRPLAVRGWSPLPARYHDGKVIDPGGGDGGIHSAPAPEPSAGLAVLIGAGIVAMRRRRR